MKLPIEPVENIRPDVLDTFPYDGDPQVIKYTTHEFTSVCPFSGLPDMASITIEYVPHKLCLELRSLKYYFLSYRNVGIYQENMTNRVFNDLYNLLQPMYLKITTRYNRRGGIDSVCTMEKGNKPTVDKPNGLI